MFLKLHSVFLMQLQEKNYGSDMLFFFFLSVSKAISNCNVFLCFLYVDTKWIGKEVMWKGLDPVTQGNLQQESRLSWKILYR